MHIIGRRVETRILINLLEKKESQFLAVYGRRRVGKTYLIRQVYKESIVFETSALHDVTKSEQIINFWEDLLKYYNPKMIMPNHWKKVFTQLENYLDSTKLPKSGKKVVFIDEIPWYDTPKSGFLPAFTAFWNGYCTQRDDILLVICGSAASWIIKKVINNKGGLHNRITGFLQLQPFDIAETSAYLLSKNIKLSDRDLMTLYMMIGGIPYYLNHIEKGQGIPEILDNLFLSKHAALSQEFQNLYPALYKNHQKHLDIIKVLSEKQKGLTRNNIITNAHLDSGGWLSETLDELVLCGFVLKTSDFDKSKADGLFRLTDEYTIFYFRFLMSSSKIMSGLTLYNSQKFKIWLGLAFENFCMKHHKQIIEALGISGLTYSVHSFLEKGSKMNLGSQIDMVINREDAYIHIIEAKFHDAPYTMTLSDKNKIIQKRNSLISKTKTPKTVFTTFLVNQPSIKNEHYLEVVSNEIIIQGGKFEKR
ncbi:MAG TPA: ATP-binding protein [Saprospiraceae bacterium]|mgnify:CR=1 FL=1|nr:ATP-binding protein [Saprospiraceae bacterium]